MSAPRDVSIRRPAVAGNFYPLVPEDCRAQAASFLRADQTSAAQKSWIGGIVPHAGWICSGAIAGQTLATLAAVDRGSRPVQMIVVFGAVHTPAPLHLAALDSHAQWEMPTGSSDLPQAVERKLGEQNALFEMNDNFHAREHAVEVELPMIQLAWPHATVLPIEVPVIESAIEIGRRTAEVLADENIPALFLASSDLTHYGPNYRFSPAGLGLGALQWAKANDQRLLRLVTTMSVEEVMPEVRARFNACGGGAIAAMLAAAREYGASESRVLTHASSYETLSAVQPQPPTNAVGYASVIVG